MPTTTALGPSVFRDFAKNPRFNAGIKALQPRAKEFSSPEAATLAGIALDPVARKAFDKRLDSEWSRNSIERRLHLLRGATGPSEVVVGGGLHAAIYCATRVACGYPKPLVLEADSRAGGAFAMTAEPTFYLNSRNRPGKLSAPGRGEGALNFLPGAPVQPADLSGDEYQCNSDIAFCIRAALMMHARVCTGVEVRGYSESASGVKLDVLTSGLGSGTVKAQRVVFALGLGAPARPADVFPTEPHPRLFDFPTFMRHMESEKFPMCGMKVVAVIGTGDSAKTAVEALLGQGPGQGMSVASLDYVQYVDWFGLASAGVTTRDEFEKCNRSRYRGLARFLPTRDGDMSARLRPMTRATLVSPGFEQVRVNTIPYDLVINCTGFVSGGLSAEVEDFTTCKSGKYLLGRSSPGGRAFVVGPAAKIPISATERTFTDALKVEENVTAIFRYAGRTARLAETLPATKARPKRLSREILAGKDVNGKALYVGDIVRIVEDVPGPSIIGEREPLFPIIDVRADGRLLLEVRDGNDTMRGAYAPDDDSPLAGSGPYWGLNSEFVELIARDSRDVTLGTDAIGQPIRTGDIVTFRGQGDSYVVLGATQAEGYIAINKPSGGFTLKSEPRITVYGALPENLTVE